MAFGRAPTGRGPSFGPSFSSALGAASGRTPSAAYNRGMLGRVLTAIVTPFRDDGAVDYDAFQRLARHLVENGSDGIVVAGTTGESPNLSDDERLELFRAAIEAVGADATVVAGTGTYSTAHSVHLTEHAAKLAVDAVLVVTPYYNKPPQRGIVAHFEAIARASDKPIVVYNIPARVVVNIEPETISRLAEIETVRAVKQANPNLDEARHIIATGPRSLCGRRQSRPAVPRARRNRRRLRPHPHRRAAGRRPGDGDAGRRHRARA